MNLFRSKCGNHTNQRFSGSASLLVALVLACFAISPMAQAVVPAPDGGYPGANTAEGQKALFSLTTGGFNTAVGFFSLRSNTTNNFNTAIGTGALFLSTADLNTAVGAGALLSNTFGTQNTASGAFALFSNTTGSTNAATGYQALFSNTTGIQNTATGDGTLLVNTTGNDNTATGFSALLRNTVGNNNTGNGVNALLVNTTASNNTAVGRDALASNTTGGDNTAVGFRALQNNTINGANTATGEGALGNNTGGFNTATGIGALFNNTTGSENVALGDSAGINATTGNFNVYIGAGMAGVAGESNACYIASIFGQTSANGIPVLIDSSNKLGTTTSSKRFKEGIKPMDNASEALFALKPVTFRYKKELDPQSIQQWGLVAEDVQKVNPALVALDKEGKPYSVRYDQVNAMLLNEFLKEHRKVELQDRKAQEQQKEIDTLKGELKEQKALIQKVSAQLELSRPAPRTALNNQ